MKLQGIKSLEQDLLTEKDNLQAWLQINTVDHKEAGDLYLTLWQYMITATAMHGFAIDKEFRDKITPEDHWKDYIKRFVNRITLATATEKAPWDNTPQLLELEEKAVRAAWRVWQCFESLQNTLLTVETVISYIDVCLKKQKK